MTLRPRNDGAREGRGNDIYEDGDTERLQKSSRCRLDLLDVMLWAGMGLDEGCPRVACFRLRFDIEILGRWDGHGRGAVSWVCGRWN